ncbi:hypothetical protein [Thiohalorhabdus methylotrophus]|uniref:Uncharacterized protein n=1 Tax=Thiohalorhabdus methylotrophus TaxID=3242694 RepID=A0ABV4TV41_9GAMM
MANWELSGPLEPPEKEVQRARDHARYLGRSVFLFHGERGWTVETDIRAVPMTGTTLEIHPEPQGGEMDNQGGC